MADYNKLIETIDKAVNGFNDSITKSQKKILSELLDEIKKFDTKGKRISNTVKNIRLLNSIKNRLRKTILNDEYKAAVKEYLKVFTDVSNFHNEYFKETEKGFKPRAIVKEIKKQTITDTIDKLTEAGIGGNVQNKIADLLKQNITTGVKYSDLAAQLREHILTTETPGVLAKYAGQIVSDAVNQYSRQYMNTIAGDLGYEWYRYQGKDILTTRHFCDAMTDRKFFHVSEVPSLLKAEDLYYSDVDGQKKVPIYEKTGLPHGMIEGTNPDNFFIRAGGYQCKHSIFPVIERLVPKDIQDRVKATAAYRKFKGLSAAEIKKQEPVKEKEVKFVPAKTVQEAEERLTALGISNVNLKGVSMEVVNGTLDATESEHRISPLTGLKSMGIGARVPKNYRGQYKPGTKEIEINKNYSLIKSFPLSYKTQVKEIDDRIKKVKDEYLGNPKFNQSSVTKHLRELNKSRDKKVTFMEAGKDELHYSTSTSAPTVSEQAKLTTIHEIGHFRHLYQQKNTQEFKFDPKNVPTEYAAKDRFEYYAEWYTVYRSKGEVGVPKDLLELFKKL